MSYFPLQQTQIPDYAELIVKFLDALIDTYLPGIDEETSEESLLTPTSPYPPVHSPGKEEGCAPKGDNSTWSLRFLREAFTMKTDRSSHSNLLFGLTDRVHN